MQSDPLINEQKTEKPISIKRLSGKTGRVLIVGLSIVLMGDTMVLLGVGKWHLGTLIPFGVGAWLGGHALFWQTITTRLASHSLLKRGWQLTWAVFVVWLISVLGFFYFLHHTIAQGDRLNAQQPIQAILVLGSGFKNGQPTPTLASRLDTASTLAKAQPRALIVLTGGVGLTETESEAQVMARYLQQRHGLPATRMALEDKSTSTELNIKNSTPILATHGIDQRAPIAIVTSDFHTLRALKIAKKQGYQQVLTLGSKTPLLVRYNNWLREYFAFVGGWALNEF